MLREKKGKKSLATVVGMLLLSLMTIWNSQVVCAAPVEETAENAIEGSVRTVTADSDIYADSMKREKLGRVKAGELIFVTGEEQEWLQLLYHGEFAYIEKQYVSDPADQTALVEEMEDHEEDAARQMEQFLETQRNKRGRVLWGILIAVLIILIFVTGIRSTRTGEKGKKKRRKTPKRRERE